MISLVRNFRSWWRPSRKAGEQQDRSVSFLELFYDLAYVVLVAELAHALAGHLDLRGIGTFAFLFLIVWMSWLNGSVYHDLHGNNDIRTRIFTFAQMFAIAGMALFAHNALGEGSVGFALSYGGFQLVLTYLWWRTGVHDPDHAVLSFPYAGAFLTSAILFLVSAFVPPPLRFVLWGVGVAAGLLAPLRAFLSNSAEARAEQERSLDLSPSLVERFGLFTILVLAEVIVGVVTGLADREHLTATAGWSGVLGMVLAFALWGLYFDYVSHRPPIATRGRVMLWYYLHLFMTMSIGAVGAAVLDLVEHAGGGVDPTTRWLLVGAVALFMLCVVVLMQLVQVPDALRRTYRTGGVVILVSALAVALLGLTRLGTVPLLAATVALMVAMVIYGFVVWVTVFGARELQQH